MNLIHIKQQIVRYRLVLKIIQKYYNFLYFFKKASINKVEEFTGWVKKSNNLKNPGISKIFDNNLYGHEYVLSHYSQLNKEFDAYIEHGLFFGNHIQNDQKHYFTKNIITFSNIRAKCINRLIPTKSATPIGPYIHYAREISIEQLFLSEKLKKGKTLLYVPDHSTSSVSITYQISKDVKLIEELKSKYDIQNVVICCYYKDLYNSNLENYIDRDCIIFTAGSKWEKTFLSRLKTIINLSDYVVSGAVGTIIGYSVYLNKPTTIIDTGSIMTIKGSKKTSKLVNDAENDTLRKKQIREIQSLFEQKNKLNQTINKNQWNICDKYWGFSQVKDTKALHRILNSFNNCK